MPDYPNPNHYPQTTAARTVMIWAVQLQIGEVFVLDEGWHATTYIVLDDYTEDWGAPDGMVVLRLCDLLSQYKQDMILPSNMPVSTLGRVPVAEAHPIDSGEDPNTFNDGGVHS